MRDKLMHFIKKQWIIVWIFAAVVALSSIVVLAEYTATTSVMKRVVVSTSGQGNMFSSNTLEENGQNIYVIRYFSPLQNQSDRYPVEVLLWNYNMNNPSKWYQEDIEYTIQLSLTDSSGTPLSAGVIGQRSVQFTDGDGNVIVTLDGTTRTYVSPIDSDEIEKLVYSVSSGTEKKYYLKYSGNWNLDEDTDICVKMEAIPYKGGVETKYQDITTLAAIIGLKKSKTEETTGWQAYVLEKTATSNVDDYDGYNMVVTGAGKAKITIKWDIRYLECNKSFNDNSIHSFGHYTGANSTEVYEVVGPTIDGNVGQLVINADTSRNEFENRNRYDIQFYKTGTAEPADWNFVADSGSLSNTVWLVTTVEQD